jgi:protein-S-isoprenylcysteine O-methyltransferase Ste14
MLETLELKVPPVLAAGLAALGMWAASQALPGIHVAVAARAGIALVLLAIAAGVGAAGVAAFRAHRTTVNPLRPDAATSLVTGGVYRWTRNPMYLALALGLAALAVYLSNPAAFLLVPAFVAWMTRLQILPEERALAARFGPEFHDYRRRVRRWL